MRNSIFGNQPSLLVRAALALAAASALPACGAEAANNGDTGGNLAPPPVAGQCLPADGTGAMTLAANPANNYAFTSHIDLPPVTIGTNQDIKIDWSGMTQNFLGRTISPLTDIDMIGVLVFRLTQAELIDLLNQDELGANQNESAGAFYTKNAVTQAQTFQLVVPGQENTPIPMDELLARFNPPTDGDPRAYTVNAIKGTDIAHGIQMLTQFVLDPASTNTTIQLTNTSANLTYTADLETLAPVGVPPGSSNITISWKDMENNASLNAMGRTFSKRKINKVLVGHYAGAVSQLEADFLKLDDPAYALGLWQGEVAAGSTMLLSELKDANGVPFAGIDSAGGTWVVALQCGTCGNPAPWFLTVLAPCDPAAAPAASM